MANRFTTPVGKLAWSNILAPTLNLKQEREWNCGLVLSEGDSQGVWSNLEECLRQYRERNPSFPKENGGLNFPYAPSVKKDAEGRKVPEPGMVVLKFKRPAAVYRKSTKTNESNTPPIVFDSAGRPVQRLAAIRPGSTGRVIYDTYGYDKASQRGVGLQILGFQIFSLNVDTIEVDTLDGGWVSNEGDQAAAWRPPTVEEQPDTVPDINW